MKTNLFKIAMVTLVLVSAAALPAHADRYDKKRSKKETNVIINVNSGHHGHHGRGPSHHHRRPRPVYVQPRPVYVAPQPVYTGRAVYGSSVGYDVQRALAKRGYYGGVIDGDIGPRSRAAIRSYQVDKGLPVTGLIDTPLLRSLRLL